MAKGNLTLCYLSKGVDVLFYLVAIATVTGSCILLFTNVDEESIVTPLLIANAVIFTPIFLIGLWRLFQKKGFLFKSLSTLIGILLLSPIPYLAILYVIKTPASLRDILLSITAISPFFTSFSYMIMGLFRDCMLCDAKGCDF